MEASHVLQMEWGQPSGGRPRVLLIISAETMFLVSRLTAEVPFNLLLIFNSLIAIVGFMIIEMIFESMCLQFQVFLFLFFQFFEGLNLNFFGFVKSQAEFKF